MLLLRKQPLAPVCCYLRMLHNKPASWSTSCSPLIRALGLSTSSTAAGLLSTTGAATGCSITGSGTGLWNTGIQYGSEYIYFALQRLMHIFWTAHHSKPSHIAEQGNCKLCKQWSTRFLTHAVLLFLQSEWIYLLISENKIWYKYTCFLIRDTAYVGGFGGRNSRICCRLLSSFARATSSGCCLRYSSSCFLCRSLISN